MCEHKSGALQSETHWCVLKALLGKLKDHCGAGLELDGDEILAQEVVGDAYAADTNMAVHAHVVGTQMIGLVVDTHPLSRHVFEASGQHFTGA